MGVEVDIPNPDDLLKPGMYARVDLLLEVRQDAMMLPLEALTGAEGRPTVLVVRDGKVAAVPVELGPTDGPSVQVTKGVAGDTDIILQGKDLVREGMTVRAVPAKAY
jgi:multidrug efflux pump subunit AcrA (membrane-fusion protein)